MSITPKDAYNIRVISSHDNRYTEAEIASCSPSRLEGSFAADRGQVFALKLEKLPVSFALQLKHAFSQESGAMTVSHKVVDEHHRETDAVVTGTKLQLQSLYRQLQRGSEELTAIAREMLEVIAHSQRERFRIRYKNGELDLSERTLIMGILNVTPDSFYDGGRFLTKVDALQQAHRLIDAGADIIDIGGESTRPGAEAVEFSEELSRVIPVIRALSGETEAPISIDTYKAEVAQEALAAGAVIVNDITGLFGSQAMAEIVAENKAPIVVMHIKGTPRDMQKNPVYKDLLSEVVGRLRQSINIATACGVEFEKIIVDPGIGFGKRLEHNLEILDRLGELRSLGRPVLVGPSRKSFIGQLTGEPLERRLPGTAAACAVAIYNGAKILRTHDVEEIKQVAVICDAIKSIGKGEI